MPNRRNRSRLAKASATVALALAAASAGAVIAPTPALAYSCYSAYGAGNEEFYDGPKSSNVYDTRFYDGPYLGPTVLDGHVPQGLATWENYFGTGIPLIVYTAYDKSGSDSDNAYIQGIDPRNGNRTRIAEIAGSHVGGIAVHGSWVFVSGRDTSDGKDTIRKYRKSDLKAALQGTTNYVKQVGEARIVYGSSFLADYNGYLFAGRFDSDSRNKMYRYLIQSDGTLVTQTGAIEIPMETQGLMVTADKYVFSASEGRDNRSRIVITDKGKADLDYARPRCFMAPSMSEGIALGQDGRTVSLLFESGASKYASDPNTRNVISNLHHVQLGTLMNPF